MELSEARAKFPHAKFVRLHLLLGITHSEDPHRSKFKARIVALGNDVRDSFGRSDTLTLDTLGVTSLTVEASRCLDFYCCAHAEATAEMADAIAAYLQAYLGGDVVILEVSWELVPPELRGKYRRLVVPCHKAVYGLTRSGFDWEDYFKTHMVQKKNWKLEIVGSSSVYTKWMTENSTMATKIGQYVDDFKAVGTPSGLQLAWNEIREAVKLGEVLQLSRFLGINHTLERLENGIGVMRYNMGEYVRDITARFAKETGAKLVRRSNIGTLPSQEAIATSDGDEGAIYCFCCSPCGRAPLPGSMRAAGHLVCHNVPWALHDAMEEVV